MDNTGGTHPLHNGNNYIGTAAYTYASLQPPTDVTRDPTGTALGMAFDFADLAGAAAGSLIVDNPAEVCP